MDQATLFVIIPAYNEENNIGCLLESLYRSYLISGLNTHIVLVDHQSTDRTKERALEYKEKFDSFTIIKESFPKRCGGKPRNKGFLYVLNLLSGKLKGYEDKAIISTIDADSLVPRMFYKEIVSNINKGFEIVAFNERYNPAQIQRWISLQEDERKAVKIIGGTCWIRYQFVWALSLSGIRETRGSAGYAILPISLKQIKHFQPFDKEGNPVTGENNRLAIKANTLGMKIYMSPFTSLSNPRREIFSLNQKDSNKGYKLNRERSETFALSREEDPRRLELKNDSWEYLRLVLKRMIRMALIRAVAFDKLDDISWFWPFPSWQKIINIAKKFLKTRSPSRERLEIVGDGIYNKMFDYVNQKLGEDEMKEFLNSLLALIPDYKYLKEWINNPKEIAFPGNTLIGGLRDKFLEVYSHA